MVDQAQRLREMVDGTRPITKRPRVIAITSGKGGVGKTCVAVNLGITLSSLGQKVLLVDADLGLANVDVMLGLIPRFNLGSILFEGKPAHEVITDGPQGLKILAGASGLDKLANLSDTYLEHCMKHLNDIEHTADIMLIDTGAGISKQVLKFVLAANEVIIVTTPEPPAITDAYGIIKVVASSEPQTPIRVIINRVQSLDEGELVLKRLSTVAERFLGIKLLKLGFIPDDAIVVKGVKEQSPFVINNPQAPTALYLQQIAKNLLNYETNFQPLTGSKSFFERFLKYLR